jgi:glyoxylase-like metal-dependent hydrolase (beta-lactamase superfamily II)
VAALDRRLPGNAPGSLFVDASCIACDTCRRVAPGVYGGGRLFTGDHLWAGADGRLEADRDVCWHSWAEQALSMRRLLDLRFEAVLPGHGRPWRAGSPAEARAEVARVAAAMARAR